MDPTGLPHSVIVALENVVATRYLSAAGYVLILYDHLLTLDDEVEYVWSAPTTLAKILFLILRYMVPLFLTAQTITRSGLPIIVMSDVVCKAWTSITSYAGWLSIAISNFLVLLRIWTTLPRGHRFIPWSLGFFVVMQLTNFAVTTWVVSNMIPVLVFEPLVGLCTFATKPSVVGLWVPGLVFEVVVFITVCWNTLDRPRALETDSDRYITHILFRDGVVYFVILFVLRIANTIIAIVAPISSIFVIVFFIWAATTMTTSRLIINSRRAVGQAARLRELQMVPPEGGEPEARRSWTGSSGSRRRSRSLSMPLDGLPL
ncbi:hypothetical protein B0H19DRAFT_1035468 [Mycena capillaripes]|nr:hypothetical protein B0H19DRAFT_1035468 [Mycena capillaripes]